MSPTPSTPVRVECPACHTMVPVQRTHLGTKVTCENCLEEFVAEMPGAAMSPGADRPHRAASARSSLSPASPAREFDAPSLDRQVSSRAGAKQLEKDYFFTLVCRLCSTRIEVTDRQIGHRVRCPDCHSKWKVTPPAHRLRRPLADGQRRRGTTRRTEDADDAAFTLASPDPDLPGPPDHAASPGGMFPPRGAAVVKRVSTIGEDALRAAEEEATQRELEHVRSATGSLTHDVYVFLFDPTCLSRCCTLAVGLQLEVAAVVTAVAQAQVRNAMSQGIAVALFIVSVLLGSLLVLAASVSFLTVLRESAAGAARVERWPTLDLLDWAGDAMYVVCATFPVAVLSAGVARGFLFWGPTAFSWALTVSAVGGGVLLFPVLLLSALESGSPVHLASAPVWRSLQGGLQHWLRFFGVSAILGLVGVAAWQLRRLELTVGNFAASLVVIAALFCGFRFLGRLARSCQEWIREDARTDDGADDESL